MSMVKTSVEIDHAALAVAAEALGTTTKKDTVNAALLEVGQRLVRLRAWPGSARSPTGVTSMSSSTTGPPADGEPRGAL